MSRSSARPLARVGALLASASVVLALGACSSDDEGGSADAKESSITVFAAASLTSTFTELAKLFEADHDGVTVKLSFAGSSDLAAQITEGAPADVFASADEKTMATVTAASAAAGEPTPFATNTLEIATAPGNPAKVTTIEDLADPAAKVVLCAPQVPCGAASQTLLAKVGVTVKPVSEEQSVTDVLGKITSGEADAGLVYVTDVVAAGDAVTGVEVPEARKVVNTYPIVALKDASDATVAQQFVDFVTSAAGQTVLTNAGFGAP